MENDPPNENDNIRKIEDIIDMQKAESNFSNNHVRQVAFNLPSETESCVSTKLEKCLKSKQTFKAGKKKSRKFRSKRHKSPLPDAVSWPSDSDITVLRMKLHNLGDNDIKENSNFVPGDGLHQPDSSSMVNLATIMHNTQSTSKHSVIDEYYLPISSWEKDSKYEGKGPGDSLDRDFVKNVVDKTQEKRKAYDADSDRTRYNNKKAKLARFLRLYFFPCCTCLYEVEMGKNSDAESRD